MNEGLASLRSSLLRVSQAHAIAFRRTRGLKRRGEASSPFHKRYSRAKFAVSRYANLAVCLSGCLLPSVVKDRSRGNCSRNLRSRRSAGPVWSRRCEKSSKTNKKPGDERRANPSILWAFIPWPSDGCARSSFSFYPVFVTNLTSGSVGRPGPSADSPTNQGSTNIGQV